MYVSINARDDHRVQRASQGAKFTDLFVGAAGRAMFIGVFLMIFQQLCGIDAIVYYTSQV